MKSCSLSTLELTFRSTVETIVSFPPLPLVPRGMPGDQEASGASKSDKGFPERLWYLFQIPYFDSTAQHLLGVSRASFCRQMQFSYSAWQWLSYLVGTLVSVGKAHPFSTFHSTDCEALSPSQIHDDSIFDLQNGSNPGQSGLDAATHDNEDLNNGRCNQ